MRRGELPSINSKNLRDTPHGSQNHIAKVINNIAQYSNFKRKMLVSIKTGHDDSCRWSCNKQFVEQSLDHIINNPDVEPKRHNNSTVLKKIDLSIPERQTKHWKKTLSSRFVPTETSPSTKQSQTASMASKVILLLDNIYEQKPTKLHISRRKQNLLLLRRERTLDLMGQANGRAIARKSEKSRRKKPNLRESAEIPKTTLLTSKQATNNQVSYESMVIEKHQKEHEVRQEDILPWVTTVELSSQQFV